jgi:Tol biopolymer transport system component
VLVEQGATAQVGGAGSGAGNVIAGSGVGVEVQGTATIQGNRIGTNAAGVAAVPNDTGIRSQPSGSATVGGAAAGEGNLIAGSTTYGVSRHAGFRAIGELPYRGLRERPLEVEGRGEGQRRVGSLTVAASAAGTATFSVPLTGVADDETLTATATDAEGNTSTFSPCVDVGPRTVPLPGPRVPGATNGAIAWSYRGEQTQTGNRLVGLAIASMFPDGSGATSLTPGMQDQPLDTGPAWSPDGNRIAFTRCGPNLFGCNGSEAVYLMNADGSGLQLVAAGANRPAWSPDGTKLAYAAQRSGGETPTMHGLFIRPSDLSGPAVRVPTGGTSCPLSGPAWDGSTHLLVTTGCLLDGWQGGLHRVTIASGQKQLEVPADVSNEFNFATGLRTSSDGSLVLFTADQDTLLLDRTTGDLINLTRTYAVNGGAVDGNWSPDGTRLVYAGRPEPDHIFREIWIAAADGSGAHPISENDFDDAQPAWQPCVAVTVLCGPPAPFTLTVSVTGSGTVTSSAPGIDCPADCSEPFARNSSVTLSATPASGWHFSGWSGDCDGTGACEAEMTQARSVTAAFAADPVVTPTPSATPTPTPSATPRPSPTPRPADTPSPPPSAIAVPTPEPGKSPGGTRSGLKTPPTIKLPPTNDCIKRNLMVRVRAPAEDRLDHVVIKVDKVKQKVPSVDGRTSVKLVIKKLGTATRKRFKVRAARRRFHKVRVKAVTDKGQEAAASGQYKVCPR